MAGPFRHPGVRPATASPTRFTASSVAPSMWRDAAACDGSIEESVLNAQISAFSQIIFDRTEEGKDCPVPFRLSRRSRGQGSAVLTAQGAAALLDGVGFAEP
jgi:hypothetical protein